MPRELNSTAFQDHLRDAVDYQKSADVMRLKYKGRNNPNHDPRAFQDYQNWAHQFGALARRELRRAGHARTTPEPFIVKN